MNRIYSLVWNRALHTVQVASELARPARSGGASANAAPARRKPLALACVMALGMAALVLPTWSAAACPPGSTSIVGTTGAAGTTGSDGNGTAGGDAYAANAGDNLCATSGGPYGGAGGDGNPGTGTGSVSSTGGAGGAGISGSGFTLTNSGAKYNRVAGGNGGYGYTVGGAGGVGVIDTGGSVTNYNGINGGDGGYSRGQGGAGGAGMAVTGTTIVNYGAIWGGSGGDAQYYQGHDQANSMGGAGGAGVTGSNFNLTNTGWIGGGGAGWNDGFGVATGGAGGAGVSGSGFTLTNGDGSRYARIGGGSGGDAWAYIMGGSTPGNYVSTGGAGGAGVVVSGSAATAITNTYGSIYGGDGGGAYLWNSTGSPAPSGGGFVTLGGVGGAGISVDNTGTTSISNASGSYISGGRGGEADGSYNYNAASTSATGGAGGAGVTGTGFKLTNEGSVSGGEGGRGFGGYATATATGVGGAGGAGVSGSGFYVSNSSTIIGGDGGRGYAYGAATGGAGGAGVAGSGVTLVNSGFIAGGRGGDSYTYVDGTRSSGYVSTGGAAGAGVSINNAAGAVSSVTNTVDGVIIGGESAGTAYERGVAPAAAAVTVVGNGGNGGAGIAIDGAGTTNVTNDGILAGGYGGYAYVCEGGTCSTYTGHGGAGGAGINVAGSGSTTITNTGYIYGGHGGNAWSHGTGYTPGTVGAGGAGISVSSSGTTIIDNSGKIYGGEAGGGSGSRAAAGGAGVTGTGFKLTNGGGIYGGGGNDVGTFNGYNGPVYGGAGGAGVSGSGFTATNTGTIGGGAGGSTGGYYSTTGVSGAGGAGVSGSDFTLTNSGSIYGGHGGYAGSSPSLGGAGGVGIDATGRASVITSGSIMGGLSGDGATQADAVDFSGGGNSLTLESGYSFVGNVVSSSGTTTGGDTLALGGTTNDTFDVSQIVAAAPTAWTGAVQYYGFANYAKVDGSTWTLTNTTSVVTPWTLAGGVLQISSDANLGAPTGGLTFNGGTLENTAAITTARSIAVQGAGTLQNDADFTSSGSVSGAGALTKTGVGTLTFNGNGSAFSGSTNVATGTLLVGGDGFPGASLGGATTVATGATLGGFGTIGSLNLFGNLSPGASIGTLHATGDATFESGSAYLLDVSPTGQSDLFTTKGSVAINGGTVEVQPSTGTWAPITKYTIVTGDGGVSGTFAGLTGAPTPHWGLLYDSNDVYLILGTDAFNLAGAAQTVNQRNTAGGVSSLGWGSPLFLTLAAQDASAQQAAFDQASGEFNASQQAALSNDSRFVREQMNKRLRDGDADDSAAKVDGTKLTAWVHGWGHWGQIDGDGNAAQMSDNGDGLLVGADLPVGASGRVGFTGGAERNSLSVHDRSSWADVTQTWLGTYGGFEQGAFAFRAGVAYAWNRIPAYRAVALPMMAPQTLSSNAIGNTTTGYIEGAWNIQTAAGKLAPYLNLANVRVHTDASNEAGGMAALHMDSASMDTSLSTLGVRGNWQLASKVALDANLGWVHAFGDITPERTQQFLAGGDAFTVYGTPLAQNAGQVNVNLTWQVAPNAQVVLGYDGLYGSSVKDTAAKASFNVAF
jgi:uncharacterized protein with beta-barrel porin domain